VEQSKGAKVVGIRPGVLEAKAAVTAFRKVGNILKPATEPAASPAAGRMISNYTEMKRLHQEMKNLLCELEKFLQ